MCVRACVRVCMGVCSSEDRGDGKAEFPNAKNIFNAMPFKDHFPNTLTNGSPIFPIELYIQETLLPRTYLVPPPLSPCLGNAIFNQVP